MRLASFIPPGSTSATSGEVRDGRAIAFSDTSTVLDRLRSGDRTPADGPSFELAEVSLLAPVPQPRTIFGIGMNYADHIAEVGGERPERPVVFLMPPSAVAAPNAPVHCPEVVKRLDYEGELAVVIGVDGQVAGYAVADDVSARDLQRREPQWSRAKGADGFCPYGPWITTADEVADPHALRIRTWVNGQLRQDSSTSNMIFDVAQVISFIGETCTLAPGDLILTGTPAGVGMGLSPPSFLASGDVVRIEIEGLGTIEHPIA